MLLQKFPTGKFCHIWYVVHKITKHFTMATIIICELIRLSYHGIPCIAMVIHLIILIVWAYLIVGNTSKALITNSPLAELVISPKC